MFLRKLFSLMAILGAGLAGYGQACTVLGQTPATAFPVCGTNVFTQKEVPICGNTNIPVPCNDNAGYQDKNPFWYKFTCFTGGTLGFVITPDTLSDDYDWQLFDITRHNPNDVFTDKNLFVCGNWSGEGGLTGTGPSGNSNIACAGYGQPLFSKMPTLIQGHEYLLLVSHFTNTQSGYKLSFSGGTASITDPKLPALESARAGCGGVNIFLKLNKKMKCSTLAADGSDFAVSGGIAGVTGVTGVGCSTGFDMDSIVLTMSNALTPGNYDLSIKNGSDLNSLLDYCDRDIPAGDKVPFYVAPVAPTPMDSIEPVACLSQTLYLDFPNYINCNSIAANGSDFTISGPQGVTITAAAGACNNQNLTRRISLSLSAPIQVSGQYQVTLKRGSDGNTLMDECSQETPAGSQVQFTAKAPVSAAFSYVLRYGCKSDTVLYQHDGANGVNEWTWTFDNAITSPLQNPVQVYTHFGTKQTTLKVSNGVCSDSATQTIVLDNTLIANFDAPSFICPQDLTQFTDQSIGNIISWNWDFGTGARSSDPDPGPVQFPAPTTTRQQIFTVKLIVENDHHCFDTASKRVTAVNTCIIAVPNAFTPNNDGHNDFLYPLNAWKADNLVFKVYNRYGQVVFETKDWTRKWDGTINGHPQESGVYVWVLQFIDHDTGTPIFKKGTTLLIR